MLTEISFLELFLIVMVLSSLLVSRLSTILLLNCISIWRFFTVHSLLSNT